MVIKMNKKRIPAGVFAAFALTVLGTAAYATELETTKNVNAGASITQEMSEGNSDGSFSVEMTVVNAGDKERKFDITIGVYDENDKLIAAHASRKTLAEGKSVPVTLSSGAGGTLEAKSVKLSATSADKERTLYVSGTGSDEGTGTAAEPLKTVEAAIEKVREYNESGEYDTVSINVAEGEYSITKTQELENLTNIRGLTISGEKGKTVFSSGMRIKGSSMKKLTSSSAKKMFPESVRDNIYYASLSGVEFNEYKKEGLPLYTSVALDGEILPIARYPKSGESMTATPCWGTDAYNFSFTAEDVGNWKYIDDVWIGGRFGYTWDIAYGAIKKITAGDGCGTVSVEYLHGGLFPSKTEAGKGWFALNVPEELSAGEYVIQKGTLFFCPDKDITDSVITVNTAVYDMFDIDGMKNVTVENIIFENSRGHFLNVGEGSENVAVLGCTFRNNSESAVYVGGYRNSVRSCDFYGIGGNPITVGGGDRNTLTKSENTLINCKFFDFNRILRTNCCAVRLEGCGVTVKNNLITGSPHSAFTYGGNDHTIEYNEFYDCMKDKVEDAGIVYVGNNMSVQGTVFKNNYIHDSFSGLGAIYYDDRESAQTAEHNVLVNLDRVLFIHGGILNSFKDNYVKNASVGVGIKGLGAEDCWFTESANDTDHYFLRELVTLPWTGEIWQRAYGEVLSYVNTKTSDNPEKTTVSGNYFIDVENPFEIRTEMEESDILGKDDNFDEISDEKLAEYSAVIAKSGIYTDSYRTK